MGEGVFYTSGSDWGDLVQTKDVKVYVAANENPLKWNQDWASTGNLSSVYVSWGCASEDVFMTEYTDSQGVTYLLNDKYNTAAVVKYDGTSAEVVLGVDGYGVTQINDNVFKDSSLKSIVIPDSVTSIGEYTFYNCTQLESVTFSNALVSIGKYAFAFCTKLESITLSNTLVSIGEYAFARCESLTSVEIPDSVNEIGTMAFNNCLSMTNVIISSSATRIGERAFSNSTSLEKIVFGGTKEQWNNMTKGEGWNNNTGSYTVYCTDGNISK